jgi:hypothetical protein
MSGEDVENVDDSCDVMMSESADQASSSSSFRGSSPRCYTLPKLGSRVRVPSSAPTHTQVSPGCGRDCFTSRACLDHVVGERVSLLEASCFVEHD